MSSEGRPVTMQALLALPDFQDNMMDMIRQLGKQFADNPNKGISALDAGEAVYYGVIVTVELLGKLIMLTRD